MELVARFKVRDKQAGQLRELLLGLQHHMDMDPPTIEEHDDGKPVLHGQPATQVAAAAEKPGNGKGGQRGAGGARGNGGVAGLARKGADTLKGGRGADKRAAGSVRGK